MLQCIVRQSFNQCISCIFLEKQLSPRLNAARTYSFSNEMVSHFNVLGLCMVYWVFGCCNGTFDCHKTIWVQVEVYWCHKLVWKVSLHASLVAIYFSFVVDKAIHSRRQDLQDMAPPTISKCTLKQTVRTVSKIKVCISNNGFIFATQTQTLIPSATQISQYHF